jgi:hypothetical protein
MNIWVPLIISVKQKPVVNRILWHLILFPRRSQSLADLYTDDFDIWKWLKLRDLLLSVRMDWFHAKQIHLKCHMHYSQEELSK